MYQKLITKEIEKKLPPLLAGEGKDPATVPVIFKLFDPQGAATWYITEGNLQEGILYGLCVIHEPELGYVSLEELTAFRGRFGLGIERDMGYHGKTLADAMKKEGLNP